MGYGKTTVWASMMLIVSCVLFFWGDDPPPRDADLMPAAVPVSGPDAYPIYLQLKAASASMTASERALLGKRVEGDLSAAAEVDALISRSTESAALFQELSRASGFHDPAYADLAAVRYDSPVPPFVSVVDAAKMTSIRAETLLKRGRDEEAMALALSIVDAGRVFTRSRSQLLPELVGFLLVDIGSKRALQIAKEGRLGRAQLAAAASRLSAPTEGAAGLQNALRFIYLSTANMLDHLPEQTAAKEKSAFRRLLIKSAGTRGNYFYMPHRTKGLFAARYRAIVEAAGKPCLATGAPSFGLLPWKLRPDMVGLILYDIGMPQYEKVFAKRCESDFRLASAGAGAALRAYRLDHGIYPSTLAELVPGYLPAAPVDPFTGGAPPYAPETGEIRSVGKDADGKEL